MSQLLNNLSYSLVFPPQPVLEEDFSALNIERFRDDFFRQLGPTILDETFNASNITRFRDDFNRADPAPWVASNANQSIVNGSLRVEQAATGTTAYSTLQQTTVVGKWYRVTADYTNRNITAGGAQFRIGNSPDGLENASVSLGVPPESVDETFQATGTDTYITLRLSASTDTGNFIDFDNVIIEEVPALDGWSAGTGHQIEIVNGCLEIARLGAGVADQAMYTLNGLVIGNRYFVTFDYVDRTATQNCSTWIDSSDEASFPALGQGLSRTFTASATSQVISFGGTGTGASGGTVCIDNVKVDEGLQIAPWIDSSAGSETVFIESGALQLPRVDNANRAIADLQTFVTPLKWFKVTAVIGGSGSVNVRCGTVLGSNNLAETTQNAPFTAELTFNLSSGNDIFTRIAPNDDGTQPFVESFLIEEVPALDGWEAAFGADLSVEAGQLVVQNTSATPGEATTEVVVPDTKDYVFTIVNSGSLVGRLSVGTAPGAIDVLNENVDAGTTGVFSGSLPAAGTFYIRVRNVTSGTTDTTMWDSLTIAENLVTNGTFDSDTAGWTGNNAALASVSGRLEVATTTTSPGYGYQTLTNLTVGQSYTVEVEAIQVTDSLFWRAGTTQGGEEYGQVVGPGVGRISFTATTTNLTISCWANTSNVGQTALFDNIIVREETSVLGTGRLPIKNDTKVPDVIKCGIPFDDGAVAIDETGPINHYHQGLPYTVAGRLATATNAAVGRVGGGATPLTVEGRLALGTGALGAAQFGVPYTTAGQIAV